MPMHHKDPALSPTWVSYLGDMLWCAQVKAAEQPQASCLTVPSGALFPETGSLTGLGSPSRLGWLAIEPQGSTCLCLPRATTLGFLYWLLGIELGSWSCGHQPGTEAAVSVQDHAPDKWQGEGRAAWSCKVEM